MSFRSNRKVTPKVVDGDVQKKDRHDPSPSIWTSNSFLFERERPGKGYRHILSKADVLAFVEIIPDWDRYSRGLKGVRLVAKDRGIDGLYFHAGVICIPAWERSMWRFVEDRFFKEHRDLYDRLGVPYERGKDGWTLKFTEDSARAYQLLHIFLHELGHHCDRMSTRTLNAPARGEHFAESWANELERRIWDDYQEVFGVL